MAKKEYNVDLDIKGKVSATTVPNSTGSIVTWNSSTKVFGLRTNAEIIADLNLSSSFVPYTGATANVNLGSRSITSTGGFIGNATTATTLATARTINGTSFNGSTNITTANWGTARNITIGNTTKSVNGSANVDWSLAEIGINTGDFVPYTGANKAVDLNTQSLLTDGVISTTKGTNVINLVSKVVTSNQSTNSIVFEIKGSGGGRLMGTYSFELFRYIGISYKFNITSYIYNNNWYFPSIIWVAGNSSDISSFNFIKKSDSEFYIEIIFTSSFSHMTAKVDWLGNQSALNGEFNLYKSSEVDLSASTISATILPSQFTRDSYLWDKGNFNPAQYVLQSELNTQLANYVPINGVTTINNTKTFTSSPIVPNATLNSHAVNLGQLNSLLPTVNDGKLTLTTGAGLSGSATFTANQSGNSTFTVGIASGYSLPTTSQVSNWNSAHTYSQIGHVPLTSLANGSRITTYPHQNYFGSTTAGKYIIIDLGQVTSFMTTIEILVRQYVQTRSTTNIVISWQDNNSNTSSIDNIICDNPDFYPSVSMGKSPTTGNGCIIIETAQTTLSHCSVLVKRIINNNGISGNITSYAVADLTGFTYVVTRTYTRDSYLLNYNNLTNKPTIPTTDNLIPYTGATANVNLGARSITSTGGFIGNASTATKLENIITTFTGTYPLTVNVSGTIYSHTGLTYTGSTGALTANSFVKSGGTASQFLKADGSVDSNSYTTVAQARASLVTSSTATGTSNVVTGNTNTYLNITQNGASPGSSTQITGSGSVTVSSDANGKLTITGVNTNTTYTGSNGIDLIDTEFRLSASTLSNIQLGVTANSWGNFRDYGLGIRADHNSDANDVRLKDNGFYTLGTGSVNRPSYISSSYASGILTISETTGRRVQIATGGNALDRLSFRSLTDTTQTNWLEFYHTGNFNPADYVPTARTITAGNGLSGGGSLSSNRTITLGTPTAITLSSTNSVTTSSHTHAFTPGGTTSQYIRGDGSLATMPTLTDAITTISRNGVNIPIVSQNVDIPVFSTTGAGLVPARVGSVATKYLREDGTWVTPTNTTYSAGTLALLQIGTNETNRVWSPKVLTDFTDEKYLQLSGGTVIGNLGIGIAPTAKLDVDGTVRFRNFSNTLLSTDSNGNLSNVTDLILGSNVLRPSTASGISLGNSVTPFANLYLVGSGFFTGNMMFGNDGQTTAMRTTIDWSGEIRANNHLKFLSDGSALRDKEDRGFMYLRVNDLDIGHDDYEQLKLYSKFGDIGIYDDQLEINHSAIAINASSGYNVSVSNGKLRWYQNRSTQLSPGEVELDGNRFYTTTNASLGSSLTRWNTVYASIGNFSSTITATAFYESSLRKFKTNIKPFKTSALKLINSLDIVTFDRIDDETKNKIGVIADDTSEEFLSEDKDAVDLYKTIFIQAKAIQELEKKNQSLEDGLSRLEKLVNKLTSDL